MMISQHQASDLRRRCAHYDITVMQKIFAANRNESGFMANIAADVVLTG